MLDWLWQVQLALVALQHTISQTAATECPSPYVWLSNRTQLLLPAHASKQHKRRYYY